MGCESNGFEMWVYNASAVGLGCRKMGNTALSMGTFLSLEIEFHEAQSKFLEWLASQIN